MGEHGRVNEGLVVGGVAPGGRLQDAVQEDEAVGKKQLRVTALVRVDSGIQAALILAAGGVEGVDGSVVGGAVVGWNNNIGMIIIQ